MPRYQFWSSGLIVSVFPWTILLASSIVLALLLGSAMARKAKNDFFAEGQRGSVVMQFVLLSPLLFALLLVIFQTALIVQAKLVVNYAAFCAARSAIVIIPAAVRAASNGITEYEGKINTSPNAFSPKMNIITRAGALACAGVSPRWTAKLALQTGVLPSLSQAINLGAMVALLTPTAAASGQSLLTFAPDYASRAQYALAGSVTSVEVETDHHPGNADKASYQMVKVTLNYRYYLTVPFANRIFGTRFPGVLSAYYLPTKERYTLLAEDDPTFPQSQVAPQDLVLTDRFQ